MWARTVHVCVLLVLVYGHKHAHGNEHTHGHDESTTELVNMTKVKVAQGWLEGELLDLVTEDGQYYSFKGIPYAAPPLGNLRFKAPQPPLPWNGIKKATAHGAECTQKDDETIIGSEDCLFLNVYTRDLCPANPLPVMVYIHGGGFLSGSGDDKAYGPDFLVNHGVLLVTINYRLEALGFLCLDTEEVPGNAGMKDQVLALRWVKENIRNFGGDPEKITIFGESSGGAAIGYHILSPMCKGLFNRAVSMSGVPFIDWTQAHHPRRRAFILGKLLGKETDDPKELLEFLQSIPAEKIIGYKPAVFTSEEITSNIFKLYHFVPVVEKDLGQEHFLTETPLEMLKKGTVNEVDVLIGHTDAESLIDSDIFIDSFAEVYNRYHEMVVPTKLLMQCTPDTILEAADTIYKHYFGNGLISEETIKEFAKYISESSFLYDVHRFAAKLPKVGNAKRFLYIFSSLSGRNYYGNRGAKYGMYGASHMDDLLYLFDPKGLNMTVDKCSREFRLIQLVNTVFTNFAKYGTPTPDKSLGITWPEYDNISKHYVDIGDQLKVGSNYKPEEIDFWRSVFENASVEF